MQADAAEEVGNILADTIDLWSPRTAIQDSEVIHSQQQIQAVFAVSLWEKIGIPQPSRALGNSFIQKIGR